MPRPRPTTAILLVAATITGTGLIGAAWSETVDPGQVIPSQARAGDEVGFSMDRNGSYTIVGAPFTDGVGHADAGAAYIYDLDRSGAEPVAELQAQPSLAREELGTSVAISGDRAVVGAPSRGAGRVLVFVRSVDGWVQQAVLRPPSPTDGERFGSSVDVDGETIVVDASDLTGADSGRGATYVYRGVIDTSTRPTLQATLPRDSRAFHGNFTLHDQVSLDGDTLAVGDPYADVADAVDQGTVQLYRRKGAEWSPAGLVTMPDPSPNANLGASLQLDRNRLIAGAASADVAGVRQDGEAVTFARVDGSWVYDATLTVPDPFGPDPGADRACGSSVSLSGSVALVGCPGQESGPRDLVGTAARFKCSSTGGWQLADQTYGRGRVAFQSYGQSVIVGGGQQVVGAPFERAASGAAETGAFFVRPARSIN